MSITTSLAAVNVTDLDRAARRVHELPPIGLAELVERAALQTRVDRKYVIPVGDLDGILADIAALGGDTTGSHGTRSPGTRSPGSHGTRAPDTGARVLEMEGIRDFRYESVYFDTPELTSYWMAARARRRRVKMRTRAYVDSSTAYLEVKTRGARSATVKDRLEYAFDDRARLNHHGLDYIGETLDATGFDDIEPEALAPTLITRYRRTTLFVPGDEWQAESRATIDTHLTWALGDAVRAAATDAVTDALPGTVAGIPDAPGGSVGTPDAPGGSTGIPDAPGGSVDTPGIVIVETKSGARASAVDRILWAHGHRPSTISKYGTGLAALKPELTATKWSRTLRRHFAPATGAPLTSSRSPLAS